MFRKELVETRTKDKYEKEVRRNKDLKDENERLKKELEKLKKKEEEA